MDTLTRWTPSDIVVMRGVWKGKLWWVCPVYVVQDTHELLALYWPVGTPTRSPIRRPTVRDELDNRIELENRNWTDNDVLSLTPHGAAYALYVMWEASTRKMRCWYVNLQEPLRQTRIGFDTMDHMLDIVISPDRTKWRWKDEDEFSEAEAIGVYSHAKVSSIRAEGERVIAIMHANASPFCDGWEDWTPPAEWTIPKFPDGWEGLPLE